MNILLDSEKEHKLDVIKYFSNNFYATCPTVPKTDIKCETQTKSSPGQPKYPNKKKNKESK